jgi:hypothetical protein
MTKLMRTLSLIKNKLTRPIGESGTSLIEVMIAAGLASVVSLAVMRIGYNSDKALNKIETDSMLRFYIDTVIRRNLADGDSCFNSFSGYDTSTDQTITNLKDRNNTIYLTPSTTNLTDASGTKSIGWIVSDAGPGIVMKSFVPRTPGSLVGTCRVAIKFDRSRKLSGGTTAKTINFDLECKTDSATSEIDACVIASATTAGIWAKIYDDDKAYINYSDIPNGYVSIGTQALGTSPLAPLQIFVDTKINWYDVLLGFGMSIPKDSLYSFRHGHWGISESGTTNANSCLSLLTYDEVNENAIYPFVRYCDDRNYFRGGVTIQGVIGVNSEPSSLEIHNGSLVCTDTSFVDTNGDGTGVVGSNVYICGNNNYTKGNNDFISGVSNQLDAGDFSVVLGTGNKVEDDLVANTFYNVELDDLNFIFGTSNYTKGAYNFTMGLENTNSFTNSKMFGKDNRAFETVVGGDVSIGAFTFGENNQIQGDGDNYYAVIGSNNYLDAAGIVIGYNSVISATHSNNLLLGKNVYSEKADELVIGNISSGNIRFAVSDNTSEQYRNALTFMENDNEVGGDNEGGAGALNSGNSAQNFQNQRGVTTPKFRYSSAVLASSHSDTHSNRSAIMSCYDCFIADSNDRVTTGHVILGGSENDIRASYAAGIYSAYKSKIDLSAAGTTTNTSSEWTKGSSIFGGGENIIQAGENSAILGGAKNQILCHDAYSCNADLILGGSRNTIKNNDSNDNGSFVNTIMGGNLNLIEGNSNASTSGSNAYAAENLILAGIENKIHSGHLNSLLGGMRNEIDNGSYNFICGGYENSIKSLDVAKPSIDNTILGGTSISLGEGSNFNRIFGSHVTIADDKIGNLVLTDYDSDGSKAITINSHRNFHLRFANGIYLYTDQAMSTGVKFVSGGGGWESVSSKTKKENFTPVSFQDLFDKYQNMKLQKWTYLGDRVDQWNIGPMAQDFYADFGVGKDDLTIASFNISGINLAASKAVALKVKDIKESNKQISLIENLLNQITRKIKAIILSIENIFNKHENKLSKIERKIARIENDYEKKNE